MYKPLFLKSAILATGTLCILSLYVWTQAQDTSETTARVPVERLQLLSEQIDSIEVEKQVQRRNGLPLVDLEAQTLVLRDSIKTIRQELGLVTSPQSTPALHKNGFLQDYLKNLLPGMKNTIYDRVLLAAGAITIFIGLFFLFILLSLKSRRKNQAPLKSQATRAAAQYENVQRKVTAAQNAYPESFATTPSEAAALASAIPPSPPVAPLPVTASATSPRMPAQTAESDLEALVVKAGKSGLDAKEISRRYHISIDQVTLMLKMAKKQ